MRKVLLVAVALTGVILTANVQAAPAFYNPSYTPAEETAAGGALAIASAAICKNMPASLMAGFKEDLRSYISRKGISDQRWVEIIQDTKKFVMSTPGQFNVMDCGKLEVYITTVEASMMK
jgi:hypothetical protein